MAIHYNGHLNYSPKFGYSVIPARHWAEDIAWKHHFFWQWVRMVVVVMVRTHDSTDHVTIPRYPEPWNLEQVFQINCLCMLWNSNFAGQRFTQGFQNFLSGFGHNLKESISLKVRLKSNFMFFKPMRNRSTVIFSSKLAWTMVSDDFLTVFASGQCDGSHSPANYTKGTINHYYTN